MAEHHLDTERHPLASDTYIAACRDVLDGEGALILEQLVRPETVATVIGESAPAETQAFYAAGTHNVYLTPSDPQLTADHPFNRQVVSSKGLIADDQIPPDSPLRAIYEDKNLRHFLCGVLGIGSIHPYADDVSSVNVHFAAAGMELGWHFDNSSFAVTLLLQAPQSGGLFEYVPNVRDAGAGDPAYQRVASVLDGAEPVRTLTFHPGDLVLFRGRDAMHRVTPTEGDVTRMLVVFAYNSEPGVALSASALETFYGRRSTTSDADTSIS